MLTLSNTENPSLALTVKSKPYACVLCSIRTTTLQSFREHVLTEHKDQVLTEDLERQVQDHANIIKYKITTDQQQAQLLDKEKHYKQSVENNQNVASKHLTQFQRHFCVVMFIR